MSTQVKVGSGYCLLEGAHVRCRGAGLTVGDSGVAGTGRVVLRAKLGERVVVLLQNGPGEHSDAHLHTRQREPTLYRGSIRSCKAAQSTPQAEPRILLKMLFVCITNRNESWCQTCVAKNCERIERPAYRVGLGAVVGRADVAGARTEDDAEGHHHENRHEQHHRIPVVPGLRLPPNDWLTSAQKLTPTNNTLEGSYAQNVGRRKQQMDDSAEMPIPKMTMKVTRNTTNLRSEANSRYGYAKQHSLDGGAR